MKARLISVWLVILSFWLMSCDSKPKNQNPVANFSSTQSAEQLTTFTFSSAGSSDPEGASLTYKWDFGDGSNSTDVNPSHSYAQSGTYAVTLTVTDPGGASGTKTASVEIAGNAVAADVGAAASMIALPGIIDVSFDAGTFENPTRVGIWTTAKAATIVDWDTTSVLFTEPRRAPVEIRVNTASRQPIKNVVASATLPSELISALNSGFEPQLFAQVYESGGGEVLDNFQLVLSSFDPATRKLSFTLDPVMFTNLRTADRSWEAVLIVGLTKTAPEASSFKTPKAMGSPASGQSEQAVSLSPDARYGLPKMSAGSYAAASQCGGTSLSPPLASLTVTSPFGPPSHYGTDYRAPDGTQVYAMTSGTISKIGFDERPTLVPDDRSGKMVKGWGRYVVINTPDGSFTLYAHLEKDGVQVQEGQLVQAGQPIARSNNSGGSSGPHLHVEYGPNGKIFTNKGAKIDPHACIGQDVTGSIRVRDNGNLADDSFAVSINGREVCRTTIGAANSCVVGALRPGTAQLSVTVLVAPDNVGTYEITLSNGMTFADGSTTRVGSPPQGTTVTYEIIIQAPP